MHHHIKHRMLRHDPLPRLPGNLMPFSDRQLSGYLEMDIHQHQIPRLTGFQIVQTRHARRGPQRAGDCPLRLFIDSAVH